MDSSAGIEFMNFTERNKQSLLEAFLLIRPNISVIVDEFFCALEGIDSIRENYGAQMDTLKRMQLEHWNHLFTGSFDE